MAGGGDAASAMTRDSKSEHFDPQGTAHWDQMRQPLQSYVWMHPAVIVDWSSYYYVLQKSGFDQYRSGRPTYYHPVKKPNS
jgi:hypothetical protein